MYIIDLIAVIVTMTIIVIARLVYKREIKDPNSQSQLGLNYAITLCFFIISSLMVIFAARIG